jgi:hypothetical protein
MHWTYAAASVIGTSHIRAGTKLQDSKHCFVTYDAAGRHLFFSVVSDGAGSAKFGGQGASIVCRTMVGEARAVLSSCVAFPNDETIWNWLDNARERIYAVAKTREAKARDFAATLVMVIASSEAILTAHIGDGAVVARRQEADEWSVLSAPHHGEYVSTTYFVTDDPQPSLRIARHNSKFNAIAAFSDGIENLVLDHATGEASPSFFGPMAKPLDASPILGRSSELSASLAEFLASERLNERTDDDKTLVIAVLK